MGNVASDRKNCRKYGLKLTLSTDAPLIAHLDAQPSVQGYLKRLIREDISHNTANSKEGGNDNG